MAIILDTDVIIKGEKGRFDLTRWLDAQIGQELKIAAITVAELWHGIERASTPHRAKREHYVRAVVESLDVVPYTEATALVHAQVWAALESSGKMIGAYDLIVAATALERKCAVATFNLRHFAQVPGLEVVSPS
jgi:predicted nucleic acid-binding protein